jgi:hypothetical protein
MTVGLLAVADRGQGVGEGRGHDQTCRSKCWGMVLWLGALAGLQGCMGERLWRPPWPHTTTM